MTQDKLDSAMDTCSTKSSVCTQGRSHIHIKMEISSRKHCLVEPMLRKLRLTGTAASCITLAYTTGLSCDSGYFNAPTTMGTC